MSDVARGELLLMRAGDHLLALPMDAVEEIVDSPLVSRVAPIAPHLMGLVRYHERWIPLLDPARLVGDQMLRGDRAIAYAVILGAGGHAALAVDSLEGVVEEALDAAAAPAEARHRLAPERLVSARDAFPAPGGLVRERQPVAPAEPYFGFSIGGFRLAVRLGGAVEHVDTAGLGVLVDHIEGVLPSGDLQPLPRLIAGLAAEYVVGAYVTAEAIWIVVRQDVLLEPAQLRRLKAEADAAGVGDTSRAP